MIIKHQKWIVFQHYNRHSKG